MEPVSLSPIKRPSWAFLVFALQLCTGLHDELLAAGPVQAAPSQAWLVSGEVRRGDLVGANGTIFAFLQEDGKRWQCNVQELVLWGSLPEPAGPTWLYLRNGSLISGVWEGLTPTHLRWKHEILGHLQFARPACAGIILRLPRNLATRDRLLDTMGDGPEGVFFVNGDVLAAQLNEWSGQSSIKVRSEFGEQEIDLSRLVAVRFGKEESIGSGQRNEGGLRLWVGLKDGSRVLLTALRNAVKDEPPQSGALSPNANSEAALPPSVLGDCGGQILRLPVKSICFLQVLGGQTVYLSDLAPEQYIHVPFLEYVRLFYRDRNAKGGYLRAQGSIFLKGLGVYSACRLSYRLNKAYSRFESEVAVDDVAGTGGSVVFRVVVDGISRAETGPVRGGEPPRHLAVDVTGADRLDLIVEFGERADELDYADWLNARLFPGTIPKE